MGPYGIAFYNALCRHAWGDSATCEVSMADIARITGMTARHARDVSKTLADLGIIAETRRPTGNGRMHEVNVYTLLNVMEAPTADSTARDAGGTAHGAVGVRQVVQGGTACGADNTNTSEDLKKTSPAPAARGGELRTYQPAAPPVAWRRSPEKDRFCQAFGFDVERPAARIRGLAGDHEARCRRMDLPPTDAEWERWVKQQKHEEINGRPAWGSVTVMHNATERFIAWYVPQVERRAREQAAQERWGREQEARRREQEREAKVAAWLNCRCDYPTGAGSRRLYAAEGRADCRDSQARAGAVHGEL
jgi:hypothetical protein